MPWSKLPSEIKVQITNKLYNTEIQYPSWRQVNRELYNVYLQNHFKELSYLDVRKCHSPTLDAIHNSPFQPGKHIQSVGCLLLDVPQSLDDHISATDSLQRFMKACPNITSIDYLRNSGTTEEIVETWVYFLKSLHTWKLKKLPQPANFATCGMYYYNVAQHMRDSLTKLYLQEWMIKAEDYQQLSQFQHLKSLVLNYPWAPHFQVFLDMLPQLEELMVERIGIVQTVVDTMVVKNKVYSNMKKLTLHQRASTLLYIQTAFPNLTQLYLTSKPSKPWMMEDASFFQFINRLNSFNIQLHGVSDEKFILESYYSSVDHTKDAFFTINYSNYTPFFTHSNHYCLFVKDNQGSRAILSYPRLDDQRIVDVVQSLRKYVSNIKLNYYASENDSAPVVQEILGPDSLTLKHANFLTYEPKQTEKATNKLQFLECKIAAEAALPGLSKDLRHVDQLKFIHCTFLEEPNIWMQNTEVTTLVVEYDMESQVDEPIFLKVTINKRTLYYYLDKNEGDSTAKISKKRFDKLARAIQDPMVINVGFRSIGSIILNLCNDDYDVDRRIVLSFD